MEQIEVSLNLATKAKTNVKWSWTPWAAGEFSLGSPLFVTAFHPFLNGLTSMIVTSTPGR
jgi:hypothetical protein